METWLTIFALVIVAVGLYLLARRRRSAPPDDSDADHPDAGVPVKVKTGPGGKSGATALKEPDEEETI